jgi:hypothetical protein
MKQSLRKSRDKTVYSRNKIEKKTTKWGPVPVATLRCEGYVSGSEKGFHQLVTTTTRSDATTTTTEMMV